MQLKKNADLEIWKLQEMKIGKKWRLVKKKLEKLDITKNVICSKWKLENCKNKKKIGDICKSEYFGGKEIGKKGILGENKVRKIGDWETVKRKSMYDKREQDI